MPGAVVYGWWVLEAIFGLAPLCSVAKVWTVRWIRPGI